jgi:DnaJ-class molecular chaperone
MPSAGEGEAGDALVEVSIRPHRFFTRVDDDIHIELPVTLAEAFLGASIKVPTPSGSVMLKVPKGSNTGTVLRLKGKGVARRAGAGDELVRLKVVLPTGPDPELETFLNKWKPRDGYRPRKEMQP